jgi:hypothetical protein
VNQLTTTVFSGDESGSLTSQVDQIRSVYGDKMSRVRVSRVVRTAELQDTTRYHVKLMEIATGGRGDVAIGDQTSCRVLRARWRRADAIDSVWLWHTRQLIGVRWRFSGCSWSDGVRWQADRVKVGHLAGGLPVMGRLG